jgi:hypothetical protein|tara:strand:- start:1571 stop:1885 length:315 start_codon:yes stop_codon:yes gene_type:complete
MNFSRMIQKSKTTKRRSASTKRRTQKRRTQTGGVGFRPDVATGCKIGGLPVINAHSDCPKNVGPGDKAFTQALYGAGRKQKKTTHKGNCKKRTSISKKNKGHKK